MKNIRMRKPLAFVMCLIILSAMAVSAEVITPPPSGGGSGGSSGGGGGIPSPTCSTSGSSGPIKGATGSVKISVNDALTGDLLTNARVLIYNSKFDYVAYGDTCSKSAVFTLQPGLYFAIIDAPGYGVNTSQFKIKPKDNSHLFVTLKKEALAPLFEQVGISGYGTPGGKVTLVDLNTGVHYDFDLEPPTYNTAVKIINGVMYKMEVDGPWGPVSVFQKIQIRQPIPTGPEQPPK